MLLDLSAIVGMYCRYVLLVCGVGLCHAIPLHFAPYCVTILTIKMAVSAGDMMMDRHRRDTWPCKY